MKLTFTIPGPICSSNRASRIVAGRAVKSAEKRRDEERVRSLATAAAVTQGWEMPEYVALSVVAINSRLDADNLVKALGDGLQGIAYKADSRVLRLHVYKERQSGAHEQYVVTAEPIDGPKRKKARAA